MSNATEKGAALPEWEAALLVRKSIAEVIGAHSYDTGWRCSCGWTGTTDEHHAHLADVLLSSDILAWHEEQIGAKALEAAKRARRRYDRPLTEGPCVSAPDGWCYACSTGDGPVYHRACICVRPDLEDCQLCDGTGVIPPAR